MKMTYKIACKDFGINCNFVAHGKTKKEVIEKCIPHGKKVHGYTDEQFKDPKMMKKFDSLMKKE
jgi:predicted small metal-binding protein